MTQIDLEDKFTEAGELLSHLNDEEQTFDAIAYMKLMREIRSKIRKKMREDNIAAPDSSKTRLHPDICKQALALDQAQTQYSASGQPLAQYSTMVELYDLLNDYDQEPEQSE
jgi:hypothetical protein